MALKGMIMDLNKAWAKISFGSSERKRIWLKLAKMVEGGVQLVPAIEELAQRFVRNQGPTAPGAIVLGAWVKGLNNGQKLSRVIAPWVTPQERMLIAAGEESGELVRSLRVVVEVQEASKAVRSAVIGGLAYPIFLFVLALVFSYIFGNKVVPNFTAAVKDQSQWTGAAAALLAYSQFVQSYLVWVAVSIPTLIGYMFYSMPRWTGSVRESFDRFGPWAIYRTMIGGTWLITMSALVGAGVRIEEAVKQTSSGAAPWIKQRLDGVQVGLGRGLNLGEAMQRFGHGFPDRDIVDDLVIFSRYSGVEDALESIARQWIKDSVDAVKMKMGAIFAICIILVALLIAFLVGGFVDMQLQMTQLIKRGA